MNNEQDFMLWSSRFEVFARNSHIPPAGFAGSFFTRGIVEMRSTGIFLALVNFTVNDPLSETQPMAAYSRYKSRSRMYFKVKNAAGTLQADRAFPEEILYQCESEHTHTVTDGTVKGINGFLTSYKTANFIAGYSILDLRRDDRLILYRDDVPETDCFLTLLRLSSSFMLPDVCKI